MTLPNWLYDILKWVAMTGLPAFEVAIPKLFEIWGIPLGSEIAQTLDVVAVLLGTLLGVSCAIYNAKKKTSEDVEDVEHQLGADYDTDKG